jgi:hypothetical protein
VSRFSLHSQKDGKCRKEHGKIGLLHRVLHPFLGIQNGERASVRIPPQTIDSPLLSLDKLKVATHNFGQKSLIGEGSYGQVYYAELDGQAMAIKKLKGSITQDEVLIQVVP